MSEEHSYTNRLIREKSPYLLQHAHNPVDWYPWGEEAFKTAFEQDKPIFLSIGYATCHWCHVMEEETFENPDVASILNDTFVNIKVDREELPEVDSQYMEFAQSMMSGAGGWPLNVILTPQLRPFFAATYLPPYSAEGMTGIVELIQRIGEVWQGEERERVLAQADKIVEVFRESIHTKGTHVLGKRDIEASIELFYKMADPLYGGMKGAPKFPIGYQTNLLMRYSSFMQDGRSLFIAERTLDMMHRGGIYDHIGGGFSRYSVDEKWLVPHFEKMLYDNAILTYAYLDAWKLTKRELYREVCEDILRYVLRDMASPQGAFYSAEDADSEGVEGLFYTWTPGEIEDVLGVQEGRVCCQFFGVSDFGPMEGRSIIHTPKRADEFAVDAGVDPLSLEGWIADWKQQLFLKRKSRIHPLKDDKILTSWNASMIYSLVEAGNAFGNTAYLEAGLKAACFLREHLWRNGRLYRRWREKDVQYIGGLEEYAYLIRALISLFEAGFGVEWLSWALELTEYLKNYHKEDNGAFYQTDGADPYLILRRCQFSDGAEPSGNSIHCENLLRLYQLTYNPDFRSQAEDILKGVEKYFTQYPLGYSFHLMNLIRYYDGKSPTIVIALNAGHDLEEELRQMIFAVFMPHRAIIWRNLEDVELFKLLPQIERQVPLNGKTTVYICHDRICEKPLTEIGLIREAMQRL